eukprot:m.55344 g.55344  ORF g.55344 m.55344 type:complete len:1414 (+) comp11485_c0_seq1:246-4487(+)
MADEILVHGFIPERIVLGLQDDADWQDRNAAIGELQTVAIQLESGASLVSHLPALMSFLVDLLRDKNMKVVVGTMQVLGQLITKVGWPFRSHLDVLLEQLVLLLGDTKIVIRQSNTKLISSLMHTLTPSPVLHALLVHMNSANWRIREEIINVVIIALSTFMPDHFDFAELVSALAKGLTDPKSRVKFVAIEAIAVVKHLIGQEQLMELLATYKLPQDTTKAILKRLEAANVLPSVSDGMVHYSNRVDSAASTLSTHSKLRASAGTRRLPWNLNGAASPQQPGSPASSPVHIRESLGLRRAPPSFTSSLASTTATTSTTMGQSAFITTRQTQSQVSTPASLGVLDQALERKSTTTGSYAKIFQEKKQSERKALKGSYATWARQSLKQRTSPNLRATKSSSTSRDTTFSDFGGAIPTKAAVARPGSHKVTGNSRQQHSAPAVSQSGYSAAVAAAAATVQAPSVAPADAQIGYAMQRATTMQTVSHTSAASSQQRPRGLPFPTRVARVSGRLSRERSRSGPVQDDMVAEPHRIELSSEPRSKSKPGSRASSLAPPSLAQRSSSDLGYGYSSARSPSQSRIPSPSPGMPQSSASIPTNTSPTPSPRLHDIQPDVAERNRRRSEQLKFEREQEALKQKQKELEERMARAEQDKLREQQLEAERVAAARRLKASKQKHAQARKKKEQEQQAQEQAEADRLERIRREQEKLDAERAEQGERARQRREWLDKKKQEQAMRDRAEREAQEEAARVEAEQQAAIDAEERAQAVERAKAEAKARAKAKAKAKAKAEAEAEAEAQAQAEALAKAKAKADETKARAKARADQQLAEQEAAGNDTLAPLGMARARSRQRSDLLSPDSARSATSPSRHSSPSPSSPTTANPSARRRQRGGSTSSAYSDGGSMSSATPVGGKISGNDPYLVGIEEMADPGAPDGAWKQALRKLEVGNSQEQWKEKCEGLAMMRGLLRYHCDFVQTNLADFIRATLQEIHNLRSSVFRLAILTLGDLYTSLGRAMDKSLEATVSALLVKLGAEASTFVAEDIARALSLMVENVSPNKAVLALLPHTSHKNKEIRGTCAKVLGHLIAKAGPRLFSSRDVERVLVAVASLLGDSDQSTRYHARVVVSIWMDFDEFLPAIARHAPAKPKAALQSAIDMIARKGVGSNPGAATTRGSTTRRARTTKTTRSTQRGGASATRSARQTSRFNTQALGAKLKDSNWKTRDEALEELVKLVHDNQDQFLPGASANTVVFDFLPRLQDMNSKVSLHALSALCELLPLLSQSLEPAMQELLTQLGPPLVSKNGPIRKQASQALALVVTVVEPAHVVQQYMATLTNANTAIQEAMLQQLGTLITSLNSVGQQRLISRYVLRSLAQLLTNSRLKGAAMDAVLAAYNVLGDTMFDDKALSKADSSNMRALIAT